MLDIVPISLLLVVVLPSSLGLDCYKCVGITVTLDGVENSDTATIISELDSLSSTWLGMPLEANCLNSDEASLTDFKGDECDSDEMCGYMNMTLKNDDYKSKGALVLDGVIRQCQKQGDDPQCFFGSGAGISSDFLIKLLFGQLVSNYGTGDDDNEPQEVYGSFCDDSDHCSVGYKCDEIPTTVNSSNVSAAATTSATSDGSAACLSWIFQISAVLWALHGVM